MSKASEWAANQPSRPAFSDGLGEKAYIDNKGNLFLMGIFEPSQAVPLARWILEMFEEKT